jgi:hypothetical protein
MTFVGKPHTEKQTRENSWVDINAKYKRTENNVDLNWLNMTG